MQNQNTRPLKVTILDSGGAHLTVTSTVEPAHQNYLGSMVLFVGIMVIQVVWYWLIFKLLYRLIRRELGHE